MLLLFEDPLPDYLYEDVLCWNVVKSRAVATAGSTYTGDDGDDKASTEAHRQYGRTVGTLQWMVPTRPHLAFPVKEPARGCSRPTRYECAC